MSMQGKIFGTFSKKVEKLAKKGKVHIAFGLISPDKEILASLRSVKKYADITLVGPSAIKSVKGFKKVIAANPEERIASMLAHDEVQGVVRGTVDDFQTYAAYTRMTGEKETINPALVETPQGKMFFLSPCSNPEAWGKEDRLFIAENIAKFMKSWEMDPLVALYTGVRHETYKRRKKQVEGVTGILNKTYADAEWIVGKLAKKGYHAKNFSIELDTAVGEGYNIHIPVNGMVGNQIFRVILFCGGKILAAPRLGLSRCYEDNSRTEKDFAFHVKWLTAWINQGKK
ncbi:MAG: hypothetical protein UX17_C0013G0006 [Parcubacteria group bacterium GW2011_GWC2_45_7]|nr:MAG: hypothetical protein UX17_C0013G0006 [Parcubacteria group bacterium GW2011_GWC2_45_7]